MIDQIGVLYFHPHATLFLAVGLALFFIVVFILKMYSHRVLGNLKVAGLPLRWVSSGIAMVSIVAALSFGFGAYKNIQVAQAMTAATKKAAELIGTEKAQGIISGLAEKAEATLDGDLARIRAEASEALSKSLRKEK